MSNTDHNTADGNWWMNFFDEAYGEYGLGTRDADMIDGIVDFLIDTLHLSPGDTLFDQCCGVGRLALPLARRGIRIIGCDLTAGYTARAQSLADAEGLPATFHHADAYDFITPEPCDAAINWFTSFGYSRDDDQNQQMLQRASDSLRPGGRLGLDYMNVPRVLADFQPAIVDRPQTPSGQWLVTQETTCNPAAGMFESTWTTISPDGDMRTRDLETRLYLPHVLGMMFTAAGFSDITYFGNQLGEPLDLRSRRCIVVGEKTA